MNHAHGHSHDHAHDHARDFGSGDRTIGCDAPDTHYFDHVYLADGHDRNARRTIAVVWLTAATMVVEIVAGWLTGSMALLADGFHMATHAGALAVAAAAYRYARRHAHNARFTFGTGKVGDLAGFASAVLLGLVSLGIAVESGLRFFEPIRVDFGQATLIAVIGLIINLISALMLMESHGHSHDHGHAHGHDGAHGHRDNNLRAAFIHVLADALTSVLAIAALVAGRYWGWVWLDPAVGLLGALVIARWSWGLMGDTARVLLDFAEPGLSAQVASATHAGGGTIADLHVWRIGPGAHAAIISLSAGDPAIVRASVAGIKGMRHITVERH